MASVLNSPPVDPRQSDIPGQLTMLILETLRQKEECDMDEMVQTCKPYTWNVVFSEIDRLSRAGLLCVHYRSRGQYAISLPRCV